MSSSPLVRVDTLDQQLSEIERELPRNPYRATAQLFGLLRSERPRACSTTSRTTRAGVATP
jgi:hypothetical protein